MDADRLTSRQRAFVAEYLIDLNATQAYIRAGYSTEGAQQSSSDLLLNPVVRQAVEQGKAQRLSRVNLKQDDILNEMAALATSRIDHYVITNDGQVALAEGAPDNAMAAVQSIKRKTRVDKDGSVTFDVELRLWDKPAPLKLTGRHVGLYPDRVEVVGKDGGPIQHALSAMPVDALKAELDAIESAEKAL